jgi:hypothetical protein
VLLLSGMLVLAPSTIENYGKVRCEVFQGEGKPLAWFLSSRWVQHDGLGQGQGHHAGTTSMVVVIHVSLKLGLEEHAQLV